VFAFTITNTETGAYTFTLLAIGPYDVKTELAGFKSQTAKVTLSTGDRARVDVKLELGTVSESVTVAGDTPLLQTDSSRVSSRLTAETVQNAPIQGRNIINIVQLTPGASEGAANATISGNQPDTGGKALPCHQRQRKRQQSAGRWSRQPSA
jgi:hypothetical protein